MQDAVVRLQDLIYDSVASPQSWPDVANELGALAGASAALIFDTTRSPADGGLWVARNVAAEATAQYVAHYGSIDVWIAAAVAGGLPRLGNIWVGEQALEDRQLRSSEFFNDFLKPHDIGRLCTAVLSVEPRSAAPAVWCSLYRPPAADPFAAVQLDALRSLVPHLARAVRLRERLRAAARSELAAGIGSVLEQLPVGAFGLGDGGWVVTTNEAAQRVLAEQDGLALRQGRLACADRGCDRRLADAVDAAATGRAHGGDLAVVRPSGRRPYLVSVVPLSAPAAEGSGLRAVGYVFEPDHAMPPAVDLRLAVFFGLTPAERRVAVQVLQDCSPAEIAAHCGVSPETVRSQIKSLFAKTGTSRQSQLVRRLREASLMPPGG